MKHSTIFLSFVFISLLFFGCASPKITEPKRGAIEQLLLSNAVDNALAGVELPQIQGRRVFLDNQFLEAYDVKYVSGSIRALLSESGAYLVNDRANAEIIIEARSGALGVDASESILGIPAIPLAIPGLGAVDLPEMSLYSSKKAYSVSKIVLLGYNNDGRPLFSTDSLVGKSYFDRYRVLLLVNLNFTDIPERKRY